MNGSIDNHIRLFLILSFLKSEVKAITVKSRLNNFDLFFQSRVLYQKHVSIFCKRSVKTEHLKYDTNVDVYFPTAQTHISDSSGENDSIGTLKLGVLEQRNNLSNQ